MEHLNQTLADELTRIAVKQFDTGSKFKKQRLEDIQKNEEFYYGRKIKVPRGRFGVPFPMMPGFVDTLMSKIDDVPVINYGYTDLADLKLSQKVSAAWQKENSPTMGQWAMKDRWSKKLGSFSGRPIFKIFSESDPKYKNHLEVVDHEDFVCEPMGGGNLKNHLFKGQDMIFKTKAELNAGARSGLYEAKQVQKLGSAINDKDFKNSEDLSVGKNKRLKLLGLDLNTNTYAGQPIYKFIEWVMNYEGEWYYLLFEYRTGTWIRAHVLKDIFSSNLDPWESWATHEDAFNFWSKAPCDDVRPIADAIDVLLNQALENRHKRNLGQRAYDPEIFPDPSELEWQPDGLVLAKATEKGRTIRSGIYEFQTPEISGTIDLAAFMDSFLGRKTGITPEAEGVSDSQQKVGIYFGSLQQIADRLGLYNKSYRECWARLGLKYGWGLHDHMREPMMVKLIGETGVEWEELVRGEAKKAPDLDIDISGGTAEIAANEAKSKKRENSIALLIKRPDLSQQVNPEWLVQQILKHGEWEEAEIRMAMSKEAGNLEILAEAAQAIQQIMEGKDPKINRGANTAFVQKILDFATDKEVKMPIYMKLMKYAQAHVQIAIENMTRMARIIKTAQAQEPREPVKPEREGSEEVIPEEPVLGSPPGTISRSQKMSNILRGESPAPKV